MKGKPLTITGRNSSAETVPEPETIGLRTVYKRFGSWEAAVNIPALGREFPVSFHNTAGSGNYDRLQAEAIKFVAGWSEEFYRDVLARTFQQVAFELEQVAGDADDLAQIESLASVNSIAIPRQHEHQPAAVVLLIECDLEFEVEIESFVFADGTVIAQTNESTYCHPNWRGSLDIE